MNHVIYSSIFGELTKNVQIRIDAASELQKQLFDKAIFEQYLDWDTPTVGLDFEELLGKYNLTVAAATIGDSSKEPVLGSYGAETIKEKVLTHAITLPMTSQEYRKVLQILDSRSISDQARKAQLINLMWGGTERVVNGVKAKLDMIFLGALSNEGKFTFDENNNPEGGVRGMINFNQPTSNVASSKVKWTEANIETVDCFEDIMAIVDAADDKVALEAILLDPSRLAYLLRSKKARQMIWGTDKSSKVLTLSDVNDYMTSNQMPVFRKIRRQCNIQNGGKLIPVKPWNEKNIVFVPSGKLGVVKNAYADSELKPEAGVMYSSDGRIRISQWGVGETQGSNGVEFTKAQSLSLPVISEINGIYTLKTDF